jgi:RNA polymerase sigma-70 factor, ECF subfamily
MLALGRQTTVMPVTSPDEIPFTLLWTRAQPAVEGFIHSLLRDRQAADELTQEVAVAAFRNFAGWRPDKPFTSWALGIARNQVRMRWRTLSRQRRVLADPELLDALATINVELDDELEVERGALQGCLEGVKGRAWDLVRLHYYEGLPPTTTAARLGMAVGNVRVQLYRIRAVLRACIERRLAAEAEHG